MEPILLQPLVSTGTMDNLILSGVNDLDIPQHQKDSIHSQAMIIAPPFVQILQTHLIKGKDPDEEYAQQITKDFQIFTESYRQLFKELLPKDLMICFGMSSIWMGILNGLDAESGIMPNHPFKREIATCLRTISEILDKR